MKKIKAKIAHKEFTLREENHPFVLFLSGGGYCNASENLIGINCNLKGKEKMEAVTHEVIHASDFQRFGHMLTENTVEKLAKDISSALWAWGYRDGD